MLEPVDWNVDHSNMDAVVDYYYTLLDLKAELLRQDLTGNEIYDAVIEKTGLLKDSVDTYVQSIYDETSATYVLQNGIPTTVEELEKFRTYLNQTIGDMFNFDDGSDSLSDLINGWLSDSGFSDLLAQAAETAASEDPFTPYTAKLEKLTDTVSTLKAAYDALDAAQADMATGAGLSTDTIEALASANDDYLSYLYEENGVIKLNTEAWMENANAKMQEQMAEIEKETESLKEQNAALEEKNRLLDEQAKSGEDYYDQYGSDGGAGTERLNAAREYRAEIEENNRVIEENNLKIAENQGKLAIYSSLYGSITGDLDAYTSALNNFSRISNTINSVSDSFQTLANLQNQVADGFTMSLDKALEFASVYPEILNNATVAADGQLTLNADVVNSFIAGKKAELDAQIDSQITQLEADKAVLTAKMESAQAQLELAKNVGDGEGQIAKEVAEYRINTGNALTAALIEMGVEESKAYALAAAAMAGNEEEFARVAKECFENMDDNAAKAAYNMAHSILLTQAILAIAFLKLLRRRMKQLRLLLLWEAVKLLVVAPVSSVEQTEPKQAVSVLTCTKAISKGRIITMKQRLLAWTIMCHSLN